MGINCELCEAYLDADIHDEHGVAFAAGWRQSWDGWLCPLCAAAWAHPASDVVPAPIPTRLEPPADWPTWKRALWWLGGTRYVCRWVGCSRDWPEMERCQHCNRFLPLEDPRWPV